MRIDRSIFSVLAICDECNWRANRGTSAAAWTALAVHAKAVHGDLFAARKAADAARHAHNRARRPQCQ